MSAKHKISGFFSALFIAVISFFVLYFFFPEYSEKFLGTSIKSDKQAQKSVQTVTTDFVDNANKTVTDRLGDIFKK